MIKLLVKVPGPPGARQPYWRRNCDTGVTIHRTRFFIFASGLEPTPLHLVGGATGHWRWCFGCRPRIYSGGASAVERKMGQC